MYTLRSTLALVSTGCTFRAPGLDWSIAEWHSLIYGRVIPFTVVRTGTKGCYQTIPR